MFTDEAQYTRDGIQNFHNQHLRADENPFGILSSHHQQRFSINISGGIHNDNSFGPHLLQSRLTGLNCKAFLENMTDFLDDVPLTIRRELLLLQGGATLYISLVARWYQDRTFPRR
jgi:hypothetical protein